MTTLQAAATSYDVGDLATCPSVDKQQCYSVLMYDQYTYPVSMVSCILSCIGSIAIIGTFIRWKDIRSGSRWIIMYLSVADFLTASSYLLGSINFLVFRAGHSLHGQAAVDACVRFDVVCQIQSFLSSCSSMSSFVWTLVLAIYLYWTIVKKEVRTVNRLFPLYHVIAWGLPIAIVLPLLILSKLGYSPIAASGWCYIRTNHVTRTFSTESLNMLSWTNIALIFVGGKALEIFTYITVISLYFAVFCNIRRERKFISSSSRIGIKNLLSKVEFKLYAIPFLFIMLRMWGTLQFFFSTIVSLTQNITPDGCTSEWIYYILFVFAVMQAIGDGGQGWLNGVLFVLCSPKIRERVICNPLYCCCDQLLTYFNSTNVPSTTRSGHSSSLTPMNPTTNNNASEIPLNEKSSLLDHPQTINT